MPLQTCSNLLGKERTTRSQHISAYGCPLGKISAFSTSSGLGPGENFLILFEMVSLRICKRLGA